MKFVVTGGAGFIGSHIAEALVHRGDRVRILDNLCTGHAANLSSFADQVEFDAFSDLYESKYGSRPRNENADEAYLFRLGARQR